MPLPSGVKLELEFTAGVWTDITADLDNNGGWSTHFGRTSPQQVAQPATLSFSLRNPKGKYTPGVAVLSDGTAAPYFPNVTRRKRVRISTSSGLRFFGYVKSWSPVLINGIAGYCQVQASDRLDQLGRVLLAGDIAGEILNDAPAAFWALDEPVGSTEAADSSGVNPWWFTVTGGGAAMSFGNAGPGAGGATAATFAGGQYLGIPGFHINTPLSGPFTVEFWVKFSTVTAALESIVSLSDTNKNRRVLCTGSAGPSNGIQYVEIAAGGGSVGISTVGSLNDGVWHHVALTMATSLGGVHLYIDGVDHGGATGSFASFGPITQVDIGADAPGGTLMANFTGSVADVALYSTALSSARIAQHYLAAQQTGELVSDKVARFLTYAGLTSADWTIDTSRVTTDAYPQAGRNVTSACQDMSMTEGGGSAIYVDTTGKVRFRNRTVSAPAAAVLTLDADTDVQATVWQPSLDDSRLVNQVVVARADNSTQRANNLTSQAAEGLTNASVTSYADSNTEALALAQWVVADGSVASMRLAQIAVDLVTASHSLYAALQNVLIGSRIRVTNIPAGALAATQIDLIVQGWTETVNHTSYVVVFDTSPADAPAEALYDSTTYGRFQNAPDCALNASITNAATTIVIKSPTLPTFTTVGARYPFDILIDAERITLNNAPGGSSPQTFTGCTRAVAGTTAAAHASNALVNLAPASTFTL